jgi:hypothetical protein
MEGGRERRICRRSQTPRSHIDALQAMTACHAGSIQGTRLGMRARMMHVEHLGRPSSAAVQVQRGRGSRYDVHLGGLEVAASIQPRLNKRCRKLHPPKSAGGWSRHTACISST